MEDIHETVRKLLPGPGERSEALAKVRQRAWKEDSCEGPAEGQSSRQRSSFTALGQVSTAARAIADNEQLQLESPQGVCFHVQGGPFSRLALGWEPKQARAVPALCTVASLGFLEAWWSQVVGSCM